MFHFTMKNEDITQKFLLVNRRNEKLDNMARGSFSQKEKEKKNRRVWPIMKISSHVFPRKKIKLLKPLQVP